MEELSRELIDEIVEDKLKLFKLEVEKKISDAKSGAQSAVLAKLDEIRVELKESQKNQGERIGVLEREKTKMEFEVQHFKEGMEHNNAMLNKIDEKLDKCITVDNLEEKLQKPLQEIKDSVTELKNVPNKKKADWVDKVVWTIAGIVLAAVGALVLKQIGLT